MAGATTSKKRARDDDDDGDEGGARAASNGAGAASALSVKRVRTRSMDAADEAAALAVAASGEVSTELSDFLVVKTRPIWPGLKEKTSVVHVRTVSSRKYHISVSRGPFCVVLMVMVVVCGCSKIVVLSIVVVVVVAAAAVV